MSDPSNNPHSCRSESPRGVPILGHLPALRRESYTFLQRCARDYGDWVPLRLGPRRAYLLSNPTDIEEVFVGKAASFNRGPGIYRNLGVFGRGLLASQGAVWRRQRKLAQPAFNRDRISDYAAGMVRCADELTSGWRDGEVRDIHADMTRLALRIIVETVFGSDADRVWEEQGAGLTTAMESLPSVLLRRMNGPLLFTPEGFPAPTNLRLKSIVSRLDSILYPLIRGRADQPAALHNDLLSLLMRSRDEVDGGGMAEREIRDEIVTFLFAGHETTAAVMTWCWHLLDRHPSVLERVVDEVDPLHGRAPEASDRPNLKYIECVAQESMRLYPPGWVLGREAQEPVTIGRRTVPSRSILLMSAWVVQRDRRFYADPEAFSPERWDGDLARTLPRFAYFPFGGGPRICIGGTFAMMEIVMALSAITRRFRLESMPGSTVEIEPAVTLRPKNGLKMRVIRRESPQ